MGTLVSSDEKAQMQSALMDVFDTFKRPFSIYVLPEKVVISTDPNYSRFGQRDQNVFNPEVEPIKYTLTGVISHEKNQNLNFLGLNQGSSDHESQIKVPMPEGRVRIKVDAFGLPILKKAQLLELDGENYEADATPRPHGLFTPNLYTFYFKRS